MADGAVDPVLADRREDQVLGGDAVAHLPVVVDAHRLRLALDQRLGGEDVLDLAGPDTEGQRPEGAVGGGVAVAADDRHPRLGEPQLGADHVDDPLVLGAQRVDGDAELGAVGLERLDLDAAQLVLDPGRYGGAVGGDVVVGGGHGAVRTANRAAGQAQAVEGLRAGHLVDEVQVDVDEAVGDLVVGPDLVEKCRWLAHRVLGIRSFRMSEMVGATQPPQGVASGTCSVSSGLGLRPEPSALLRATSVSART